MRRGSSGTVPPFLLRALPRGHEDLLTGPNASTLNSAMQSTKPLAPGPSGQLNIKTAEAPLPFISMALLASEFLVYILPPMIPKGNIQRP